MPLNNTVPDMHGTRMFSCSRGHSFPQLHDTFPFHVPITCGHVGSRHNSRERIPHLHNVHVLKHVTPGWRDFNFDGAAVCRRDSRQRHAAQQIGNFLRCQIQAEVAVDVRNADDAFSRLQSRRHCTPQTPFLIWYNSTFGLPFP